MNPQAEVFVVVLDRSDGAKSSRISYDRRGGANLSSTNMPENHKADMS